MALHISSENNRALCGRVTDDCLSRAFAEKVTCKTCAKIWGKITVEPVPVPDGVITEGYTADYATRMALFDAAFRDLGWLT